ncbi:RDD family protein [Salinispora oceanensis]|uniref:RDD family protein n=1 Tax=Salinispora oceanensis TaxID=1050199 RepID=UPI0003A64FC0|nr:RDD family protein [Salinispora oceanensis]
MSVAPGWYLDPADPGTRRYWDGEGWLGAPIPAEATPPAGPPPPEPEPTTRPDEPEPDPATRPGEPKSAPATRPGEPGPTTGRAGAVGQHAPVGAGTPSPGYGPPPGAPYPGTAGGPPPGAPYPTWPGQQPEPRPHGLPLAGLGARLVARLIDITVVLALNVVVNFWFVWQYIQQMSPPITEAWRRIVDQDTTTEQLPAAGDQAGSLQIAILLIATALWMAYEVPSTASRGQTFGKRVMGLQVLPVSAVAPLGFGRALRRWNLLGLPTLGWFCCIGFLLQLIDSLSPLFDRPLRQALHDKRAQTVVVQLPRTPVPNDRPAPPGDTS